MLLVVHFVMVWVKCWENKMQYDTAPVTCEEMQLFSKSERKTQVELYHSWLEKARRNDKKQLRALRSKLHSRVYYRRNRTLLCAKNRLHYRSKKEAEEKKDRLQQSKVVLEKKRRLRL